MNRYGVLLCVVLAGAFTSCSPSEESPDVDDVELDADLELELDQIQQASHGHDRKSIVLVHGAWMGGWAWDSVARKLRDRGERVVVVTLPAHADDPLPATSATLAGYVERVAAAVHSVPRPVYLVGHSAAGVVISQFAENEPSAVKQLIYVAAILPQDGDTLFGLALLDQESLILPNMSVDMTNGVVSLPVSQVPDILCADCRDRQDERLQDHYRDEPLIPAATPVSLTQAKFGSVDKRYFFLVRDETVTYPRQLAMASTVSLTRTTHMNTYHCPQVTKPSRFAAKLLHLMR